MRSGRASRVCPAARMPAALSCRTPTCCASSRRPIRRVTRSGSWSRVLAETGARVSQVARLRCIDLQADRADPRLMMAPSYKGRGEKQVERIPVPITASLAMVLKKAKGDRPEDAPLLLKSDGTAWQEINRCDHGLTFRIAVERAGLDPEKVTSYALRHSSICRALLKGVPVSVVARLHDTSSREIEAHYANYIADFADEVARRGLLQPEPPVGG